MRTRADSSEPDFADLSARVYRLCLALVSNEDSARDAAQEALTRAWLRRSRRRPEVSWWTWAAGFALRVCRETARRGSLASAGQSLDEAAALSRGPSRVNEPRYLALHEAIRALPERQREVTVLRFLLGQSTRETAETLGCPVGTVKSNLHKAIANLYAALPSRETRDELP